MQLRKTIIILLGALLLVGGAFATMKWMESLSPERPPKKNNSVPRTVLVKEVIYKELETAIREQGRVRSSNQLALVSEVAGKILPSSIQLRPGESFKKGQILLQIYKEEAALNLKAEKSSFITTLANILPDIKFDYPDHYAAFTHFFEKIDLDEPLPPLPKMVNNKSLKTFLASKNVLKSYYSIQRAEKTLERYTIRAPFDGTFKEVFFESGAYVNPGVRVALLLRTDLLEIEVPVKAELASCVHEGESVEVEIDEDKTITGEVARVALFVDEQTQSVPIYVRVNVKGKELYSGQYVWVKFQGYTAENCIRVPRSALFNSNKMYAVQQDSIIKVVDIHLVKMEEQHALINGIPEGSVLVVEPLVGVNENTVVRTREH